MSVVSINPSSPQPDLIEEAARRLCDGGLVVFPTETVYGLGADATNPKAVARLNTVKGRPPEKPYSIHLGAREQLSDFVEDIPLVAQQLMERFWPGPLTIVMPANSARTRHLSVGGMTDGTLGFRLPSHPVALAFLSRCARAVVAPSANRSGSPPPTDGQEAIRSLQGAYDYLLDAGPTPLGKESTVVSVDGATYRILREGAITASQLQVVTSRR